MHRYFHTLGIHDPLVVLVYSGSINEERLCCKYRYKQAIKVAMQESDRQFNDRSMKSYVKKTRSAFGKLGASGFV